MQMYFTFFAASWSASALRVNMSDYAMPYLQHVPYVAGYGAANRARCEGGWESLGTSCHAKSIVSGAV